MQPPGVSLAQRQGLYDHGYLILRGVLDQARVEAARSVITGALPEHERRIVAPAAVATHPNVIGLFQNSDIASILADLIPFPPVVSCQVALTPGHDDSGRSTGHPCGRRLEWGYSLKRAEEIDPTTHRPKDAARYYGINDEVRGSNDGLLWMDPQRRLSNGSYTALVGVCLSDQSQPGNGQLGVLKGMHEHVEKKLFKDNGVLGVIGAEGVDWPRIKIDSRERPYCNGLPDSIRALGIERGKANASLPDWPWQELTPISWSQEMR